jgi:DNA polymerase-3 subunit alpha
MAALLSNELDNTDKIALFVAEAKAMGIAVLPPSVNESGSLFTVKDRSIRFGLSAIKNVGQAAVELIIAARAKDGPFRDLHDLCSRVESRAMNKKLLESLVKAGACDDFGGNRAELLAQVDNALAQANAQARDRDAGQASLLDLLGPMETPAKKTAAAQANGIPEWPMRERLNYEKELLGFYVTGHPLDEHRAEAEAFALHSVAQLKEITDEIDTRLCGLITKVEIRVTQKDKKPWARVTFEDLTGAMEVMIFPDNYAALAWPLAVGDVIVVTGQLDRRDDQPKLKATQVLGLAEAQEQLLRELVLHLPVEDWRETSRWSQLREFVMDAPGPIKLRLLCTRGESEKIELMPADHYGVVWTPEFKTRLEKFLPDSRYELVATAQLARAKKKPWQQRN